MILLPPLSMRKLNSQQIHLGRSYARGTAELMEMVTVELEETLYNEVLCTVPESLLKTKQSVVFLFLP